MKKILLCSLSSFFDSTGEIPYMFKEAGCIVDVLCPEGSWLLSNSFHDHWYQVEEIEDKFINKLFAIVEEYPLEYDWILLLDDATIKLANEKITSEEIFLKIMPITKIENRNILSSKLGLSTICQKFNIATPRFLNYSEIYNVDEIEKQIDFPVLLKEDFSFSGTGIQFCENLESFKSCLDKVRVKEKLVVQEFIEGEDIGLEALFHDGELIMYNVAEVLTYMYNRFSFTTRRNYYQSEPIELLLKQMGKVIGLNSFASIQYIYHKQRDIYYLIEVDCRTNMWMPYSKFTNQNFSHGIKKILYNVPLFQIPKDAKGKVEITIFDRDIRRCIKHKDIKGILQWLTNYHGYWKFLPFYDKKYYKRVFGKLFFDFFKKFKISNGI
jgi:hypothetical protein